MKCTSKFNKQDTIDLEPKEFLDCCNSTYVDEPIEDIRSPDRPINDSEPDPLFCPTYECRIEKAQLQTLAGVTSDQSRVERLINKQIDKIYSDFGVLQELIAGIENRKHDIEALLTELGYGGFNWERMEKIKEEDKYAQSYRKLKAEKVLKNNFYWHGR